MAFTGNNANSGAATVRRYHSYLFGNAPKRFGTLSSGGSQSEFYTRDADTLGTDVYLKLEKSGNVFKSYFSEDAETWTLVEGPVRNGDSKEYNQITHAGVAAANDVNIGVIASSGGDNRALSITFSEFKLNGIAIPFTQNGEGLGSVKISALDTTIAIDSTMQVEKEVFNKAGNAFEGLYEYSFESSNEEVLIVDEEGLATGVGNGMATVKISVINNETEVAITDELEFFVGKAVEGESWLVKSPDGKTMLEFVLIRISN